MTFPETLHVLWTSFAIIYALLGLWAFFRYMTSRLELRNVYEVLFVFLCGPLVWAILIGLWLSARFRG